jgi:hypothetical protein
MIKAHIRACEFLLDINRNDWNNIGGICFCSNIWWNRANTTNAWANWSINIAAAPGSRRITANARDTAGNYRTAGVTVNVT